MSSTRNMKRKRSKAGSPATSSTRQRAAAPELAQDDTTSSSTAAPDPKGALATSTSTSTSTSTTTSTSTSTSTPTTTSTSTSTSTPITTPTTATTSAADKGNNRSGKKVALDSTMRAPGSTEKGQSNETEATSNGRSTAKRNTNALNSKTDAKTTPGVDGSSGCSSSQDGTSTRRQALHVANDDDDREKRMRDLISHRSILLQRVKECRLSAERRLGEKVHQGNTMNNNNNNNNNTATATTIAGLSDDKEIAAFKTMTEEAEKADKKTREKDGGTKKRTSLSLRRGSNVGKRMNTALSSLAPGSVSSGSGGDNVKTGDTTAKTVSGITAAAAAAAAATNAVSQHSKSDNKGLSPPSTKTQTLKSSGRQPLNHPPGNSAAIAQPNSMKSRTNSKSSQTQSTKQSDIPTRGRPPNSKNTKTGKSGAAANSSGIGGGQNSFASATQNAKKNTGGIQSVSRSVSATSVGTGLNPKLVASYQGPKVKFPEAMMLREKKHQIEMKLRSILSERQQRNNKSLAGISSMLPGSAGKMMSSSSSMLEDETSRRTVAHGGVGIGKQLSSKKTLSPANINGLSNNINGEIEISRPAPLPTRRRTHWDTLLQEMSWLASDFIEERKWKLSASRLFSSKIPAYGLSSDRRKRPLSDAHRGGIDGPSRDLPLESHDGDSNSSENAISIEKTMRRKDPRQKYTSLATEDEAIAKLNSRVLSCMISELDLAIQKGGSLEGSEKHLQDALNNFYSSRFDILGNTTISKDSSNKSDASNDRGDTDMVNATDIDENSEESPGFDSIDDYIEYSHSLCKSKHKLPAKETAKALKCGKLKLSSKQKEMFEFVDKLWAGTPCSGAVLLGPPISGKTFVTATILWKQRSSGFQILICPSRSLIRWKHELNRFSNLRILIFGLTGGISNPNKDNHVEEIGSADVILCEYGLVGRMKNELAKMSISPFSVVVDLRHFFSLRKSLGGNTSVSRDNADFPSELKSNGWWADIVAVSKKRETRCLLLEYGDSDPLSLSSCYLGQKEHISILAKRAACIIGPEVFDSKSHSIHREVITWARKKGKKEITDKALRIIKVLNDVVGPMCFHTAKPIVQSSDSKWELRPCEMSTVQRKEYEKCCLEVRGALASTLYRELTSDEYNYAIPAVSNALFRLRQHCFYSPKLAIKPYSALHDKSRDISPRYKGLSSAFFFRSMNRLRNASQPDVSSAELILNNSSKLKELVSILVTEGGHKLNFEGSAKNVLELFSGAKKGKDTKHSVKRIVIFAALPGIQHVVSALLDSLGIKNELLCKLETCEKNGDQEELKSSGIGHDLKNRCAISWTKSQTILSAFCGENDQRKSDVIIATPAAFSGPNDGIGVEGADMIIALDSDWSRRDGFIVDTLVRRWCARNKLSGKDNRLIRLICADSVEQKVFSDCESGSQDSAWPLDINGFLTLPNSEDEALELYKGFINNDKFSFPASGILQHRGDLLEDVLVSSGHLASFFGSGKPAVFLPKLKLVKNNEVLNENEMIAELHLMRCLLKNERLGGVATSKLTTSLKLSETEAIPTGLISRPDMTVIESRLRLEKFIVLNSRQDNIDDNSSMHVLKPQTSFMNSGQDTEESAIPKIDENPSSLLFYDPVPGFDTKYRRFSSSKFIMSQQRCNAYAKLFSDCWNGFSVRDGNQGCEPMVFFPPLFPLLEESSRRARMEYSSSAKVRIKSHGTNDAMSCDENNPALKRKDRDLSIGQNDISSDRKRPKIQSGTTDDKNVQTDTNPSSGTRVLGAPLQTVTTSTDKLENWNVSTIPMNCKEDFKVNGRKSPGFLMVEEDFGLLGVGAFPRPIDIVSFSARDPKPNSSFLSSTNRCDYVSFNAPCDTEESGISAMKPIHEGMQSILLFVKKRPRSSQPTFKHAQGLPTITTSLIGGKNVGDEPGKKMRKKGSQGNLPVAPTAFTRLPVNTGNVHSQTGPRVPNLKHVKGDHRHKLLASLKATGLSLFDSIPYRKAALRVEGKMAKRLEKLMWRSTITQDIGPGLPVQLTEKSVLINGAESACDVGWVSIVQKPKNGSAAGELARGQLTLQNANFKRSLVPPRCVDFGVFEVGYMGSPSGMTALSTPHSRLGVSLPMGVKVMQPTKDQTKCSAWSISDDKFLQDVANKFGMNWLLVASAMSGFEHVVFQRNLKGVEQIVPSVPKSARQCRDRWEILVQNQPSLANGACRPDRFFIKGASLRNISIKELDPSKEEGRFEVLSNDGVDVFCNADDFLKPAKPAECTVDTRMLDAENKDNLNEKSNLIDSPRSTVDKKDDHINNKEGSSHVVRDHPGDAVDMTGSTNLTDVFQAKEERPKRRSFSAVSMARSKRQMFPITIPGVDMAPVSSHPSHVQSVQMSVTTQWASGRTDMWPLQILDLADRQRSNAARVSMQRGEIPPTTHKNPHRHHQSGSSTYQHRPTHPAKPATARGPVAYSPGMTNAGQPVAPRPVNSSIPSHHQHRTPSVAGATAQSYLPAQANSSAKLKKNENQKPTTKSSPKKGDNGV
eukprot:jgi/Psemu1/186443/e_gw1.58.76.1